MDASVMTLMVLKHGGTWSFLAKIFKMSNASFKRLISRFIQRDLNPIYSHIFKRNASTFSMKELHYKNQLFKFIKFIHTYTKCALDVSISSLIVRRSTLLRPRHISARGMNCVVKVEVAVSPIGLTTNCS